ncbi:hypothetical protein [Legionella sp. W05-934-2]|jgi:hypothetical protein|uniref:hypothetical protein n=1 Tax=Legionella sp. W05-934-2 TaxID=1198649 RepID=UPI003461EDA4
MEKCRLSIKGLGLALGVFMGLTMLILGLMAYFIDYGTTIVMTMNALYMINGITLANVFLGTALAFIHGFIDGVVIAFLYNIFGGNCCSKGK